MRVFCLVCALVVGLCYAHSLGVAAPTQPVPRCTQQALSEIESNTVIYSDYQALVAYQQFEMLTRWIQKIAKRLRVIEALAASHRGELRIIGQTRFANTLALQQQRRAQFSLQKKATLSVIRLAQHDLTWWMSYYAACHTTLKPIEGGSEELAAQQKAMEEQQTRLVAQRRALRLAKAPSDTAKQNHMRRSLQVRIDALKAKGKRLALGRKHYELKQARARLKRWEQKVKAMNL